MIKKYTIYGERCSGTNYLKELIKLNFDVELVWDYGWKHFFGFQDLSNTDDVLFIGIVRNLPDWVNSLYRSKYHLPSELTESVDTYLNNTFYSIEDNVELIVDRNIETGERYKNIFELRHIKNKFLVETMPKLVKNYILITHDSLLTNFSEGIDKIKDCGLQVNSNIEYPINITQNVKMLHQGVKFEKKKNEIPNNIIVEKANLFYEKILFPEMFSK